MRQEPLFALKRILFVLIAAFVVQKCFEVWLQSDALIYYGALSQTAISRLFLWSWVTYSFFHADPSHLIFNLLGIFFIGRFIESQLSVRSFFQLYFISVFSGGLLWAVANWNTGGWLVGASAGFMGILAYFCRAYWEQRMYFLLFFLVPIPVRPKWVFRFLLGLELFFFFFYERPKNLPGYHIANSAHLGGILAGVLFHYYLTNPKISSFMRRVKKKFSDGFHKPSVYKKKSDRSFRINLTIRETFNAEVDRILDKINEKGFVSLTAEEKATLERARKVLKPSRND